MPADSRLFPADELMGLCRSTESEAMRALVVAPVDRRRGSLAPQESKLSIALASTAHPLVR